MTQANPDRIRMSESGQPIVGSSDGVGVVVPTAGDGSRGGLVSVAGGEIGVALSKEDWCEVFEDFLGYFTLADIDATFVNQLAPWVTESEAGTAPVKARLADHDNGALNLALSSTSEAADISLYWGDEQNIDSDLGPIFRTRLQLPAVGIATDSRAWGLVSAKGTNVDCDAIANNAIFKVDGANLTLLIESDDATTNDDDNDTGVTLVAGTYYDFMISMNSAHKASPTNVKFFYKAVTTKDWTQLLATTTFAFGADIACQPIFNVEKSAGAGTPAFYIDFVHVMWPRT